jgi:hypothetical protein
MDLRSHLIRLLKWFFSGGEAQVGPKRASCLPRWLLALACLFVLGVTGIYAYSASFSSFAPYDDEGYMMITVQGFLHGYPLYDKVLTFYGPFYYYYEWIIHALAALPLTHDVTRAVCMFDWLLAAFFLALAGVRITQCALTGFFVFILAVLHLRPLVSEPGHPQELVAVLLALGAFIAAGGLERKSTLVLLAAIGAATCFTKINVGGFLVFALLLAICCHAPWFHGHSARFYALLALTSLVPFALMRPHLSESWTRIYAAHECAAILMAGAVAYTFSGDPLVGRARAFQACSVFVCLSALFALVLVLTGSSLAAMVENLVTAAAKLGGLVWSPLRLPACTGWRIAAFLSAAFMVTSPSRSHRWRLAIAVAKGLYGWIGAVEFAIYHTEALGYLLPWSWLVILSPKPGDPSAAPQRFARIFVCLAAVWQGLQAYPIAGTQRSIATFLLILIYAVCLYDAFRTLVQEPWVIQHVGTLDPRTPRVIEILVLAILLCLAMEWCNPSAAWSRYYSLPLLGLRGSDHLRVRLARNGSYPELTEYMEAHSDAFITLPGLNSLYFWTGRSPPAYYINGGVVSMNDEQQARLVAILQKASHPMIVLTDAAVAYAYPDGPLPRVIREQYHEIKSIGDFRILALHDEAR